jgi:hypothetical protein
LLKNKGSLEDNIFIDEEINDFIPNEMRLMQENAKL